MTVIARERGRARPILLKQEWQLPTGSIKYRTALGLMRALAENGPLRPGTVVVESTSGGLGLALAHLLGSRGCRLVAVVDPKTPLPTRRQLELAGAELHLVTETDGDGSYLDARLRMVAELRRRHPAYRWTDQYHNPANPRIHEETTGPEITAQAGPGLDAVYVAVSTGGTLAGIARHIRARGHPAQLIAVDARGSCATTPDSPFPRYVPGIGATRRSSLLGPGSYDRGVHISDADAIAMCHVFRADTGIQLGGSAGHVLRACVTDLCRPDPPRLPLCLCADDGSRYTETLYHRGWLASRRLLADVSESAARLRRQGVRFSLAGWQA